MNNRSDAREKRSYSKKIGQRNIRTMRTQVHHSFRKLLQQEENKKVSALQRKRPAPAISHDSSRFYYPPAKHSVQATRLYGCSRYETVQDEIQKKPRGGSRGVMTRNLSGR